LNQAMTIQRLSRANVLDLPAECVSDIALVLPSGLSYGAWKGVGERIFAISHATQWWIGDWVNAGEISHPQVYTQAIPERSTEAIRKYAWVASRIEPARRRVELTFSHHEKVARLGPTDQDRWLRWAIEVNASTRELEEAVREERIKDGIEKEEDNDVPRRTIDKDAVKDFSINAIGDPWTVSSHNALMEYLNINHRIERVGGETDNG
jgi:hypothetical protein